MTKLKKYNLSLQFYDKFGNSSLIFQRQQKTKYQSEETIKLKTKISQGRIMNLKKEQQTK